MKAFVYTDKSLERYAGRFVWLSVNTENAKNAAFLTKFRIPALPTLLILDSAGENVVVRYVGGMTAPYLAKLLDEASAKTATTVDEVLAAADKLAAEGKQKEAVSAYAAALASAPKGWRSYERAVESYVLALSMSRDGERCVTEARRLLPSVKGTTAAASLGAIGIGCTAALDDKDSRRPELFALFEKTVRDALADKRLKFADDDRSGMYISLIEAREGLKDEAGARQLKGEWVAMLESAAANAKTPQERTVFDSHRLSAYLDLETPEKAIPMLEQSERDFPDDYNPPARLAVAYRAMKRYDEAVAAADRALARAYGPRKLQIYRTKIEALADKGDKAAARTTIDEAIAYAKSLPPPQQRAATVVAFEKRLKELAQ